MESTGGGACVPPSELCESNVNTLTENGEPSTQEDPDIAQHEWAYADLCPQCSRVKEDGADEGWCNSVQCAFLRGYDMIDAIVDIPRSFCRTHKREGNSVAAHLLPLYAEAEKTATDLLWQMSAMIRQIVPFSPSEHNKEPFVNYIIDTEVYDYKPSVKPAFEALARMISLFAEHASDRDFARASSSLSSSSSASSSSFSSSSSPSSTLSSEPAHSHDPPPFSKGGWSDMLDEAATRAASWENNLRPFKGSHQPHCDTAKIVPLALLAILRTTITYSINSVRKLHEMCVQRFPEVTFKPLASKPSSHETFAINGIVEHDLRAFCMGLFPRQPSTDASDFEEMIVEGLTVFQEAKLERFKWGSGKCIARYAEAEERARAGGGGVVVGNHPRTVCPSPAECGCSSFASSSSLFVNPVERHSSKQEVKKGKGRKKKKSKKKNSADGVKEQEQGKEESEGVREENKHSGRERKEENTDEVKDKERTEPRNLKDESGNREDNRTEVGHEKGREDTKRDRQIEEAEEKRTPPDTPGEQGRAAMLCSQCAKANRLLTGGGYCNSLLCALLRGYGMFNSLIEFLRPWRAIDSGAYSSNVMVHLLTAYAEAEQTASDLLCQMTGMIRPIVCPGNEPRGKPSTNIIAENIHKTSAIEARDALRCMICLFAEHAADSDMTHSSSKRKYAKHNTRRDRPPFAETVWIVRLSRAELRAHGWLEERSTEGPEAHRPHCDATHFATLAFLAIVRCVLKYLTRSVQKLREMCVQRFPEVQQATQKAETSIRGWVNHGFIEHDMQVFLDGLFSGHISLDASEYRETISECQRIFSEYNLKQFTWVSDDVKARYSEALKRAIRAKKHYEYTPSLTELLPICGCFLSSSSSSSSSLDVQKQNKKKKKSKKKKKHSAVAAEDQEQRKEDRQHTEEKEVKDEKEMKEEEENEWDEDDEDGGKESAEICDVKDGVNSEGIKEEREEERRIVGREHGVSDSRHNAPETVRLGSHSLSSSSSLPSASPHPRLLASSRSLPSSTSRVSSFNLSSHQRPHDVDNNNAFEDEGWIVQQKGREKQKGRQSLGAGAQRDKESQIMTDRGRHAAKHQTPQAPIRRTPALSTQQAHALSNERSLTASNQRAPAAIPKHAHNSALPLPHPHPSQANTNCPCSHLSSHALPPSHLASQPSRQYVSAPSPALSLSRSLAYPSHPVVSSASACFASSHPSSVPHTPSRSPISHAPPALIPAPASRSPPSPSPNPRYFPPHNTSVPPSSHPPSSASSCSPVDTIINPPSHADGILYEPGSEYETQREAQGIAHSQDRSGNSIGPQEEQAAKYDGHCRGNSSNESVRSNSASSHDSSGSQNNHTEDLTCVVCQDAKRRMCFLPCGHMVCCERCAQDELMTACPMCRVHISTKIKIFF